MGTEGIIMLDFTKYFKYFFTICYEFIYLFYVHPIITDVATLPLQFTLLQYLPHFSSLPKSQYHRSLVMHMNIDGKDVHPS